MSEYKRLTREYKQGRHGEYGVKVILEACWNCGGHTCEDCYDCPEKENAIICLAQYEDSGLSPAEVMELAKAGKTYEVALLCEGEHCDDPDASCDGCKKYVIYTENLVDNEKFLTKELAEARLRELKGEK